MRKARRLTPLAVVAVCALATPATAAAAGPTTYQQTVKASSPDLYWTLDDSSVADASGNGHAGTASGVTFAQPGAFALANTSADFPGNGATVTGTPGTAPQAIELWLRPAARGVQVIAAEGNATGSGWELSLSAKKRLLFKTAGNTVDPKITLPTGAWSMVDVAWQGTSAWFVTNGGLTKSREVKNAFKAAPAPGTSALTLGGAATVGKRLDEVAVYGSVPATFAGFKALARAHFDATSLAVDTAAPTVSGTPTDGRTLTATTGTWTSNSALTYSYRWMRCDLPASDANQSCDYIDGAASSTYTLTPDDVGTYVEAEVTATNASGSTFVDSDAAGPVKPQQPTIGGVATQGQTLTAATHTSTGAPAAYALQWQRCPDATAANCSDIAGATGSTYLLGSADVGHAVRVVASLTSASAVTASAVSGATPLVAGIAGPQGGPANTAAPNIDGPTTVGATLTVSPGLWTGTPVPSFSYQWRRCTPAADCTDIAGATGTAYVVTSDDLGDTIVVRETAQNTQGTTSANSPARGPVTVDAPAGGGGTTPTDTTGTGATGGGSTGSGTTPTDTTGAGATGGGSTGSGTTPTDTTGTGTTGGGSNSAATTPTGTTGAAPTGSAGTAATSGASGGSAPACVARVAKVKPKRAKVRGIGRVKVSVKSGRALKVVVKASKRKVAKATFKLDRKRLKGKKHSLSRTVATKRLKAGRHVLRITLKPRHGKAKTLKLTLKARGC